MSLWEIVQRYEPIKTRVKCGTCKYFAITKNGGLFCKGHDKFLISDFPPVNCKDFEKRAMEGERE